MKKIIIIILCILSLAVETNVMAQRRTPQQSQSRQTVPPRQQTPTNTSSQNIAQFKADAEKAISLVKAGKLAEAKPITEKLLRDAKGKFSNNSDAAIQLFNMGNAYFEQFQYALATECLRSTVNIDEVVFGKDSLDVAYDLNLVGRIQENAANYDEAAVAYKRSLKIREKILGNSDTKTAVALNNLASLYETQGRYTEAEPLYKQALNICEVKLGKNHSEVALALNNLAALYDHQGCYSDAEPLYKRALEIRNTTLGQDHPDTATSQNNLAFLYSNQGYYSEAEPLYKQALATREEKLGKDHPDTAASLNNLALLYKTQCRYEEAELLFKQSLTIKETILGKYHPDTARAINNLAVLYESQGHYADAEPLFKCSLEILETKLGKNHHLTASAINNLAKFYSNQGRNLDAEPLYILALEIKDGTLGRDHPSTALVLNNLAALYNSQLRYIEAEPLCKEALAIRESKLGKNHPDTALALNNLAFCYDNQGQYTEAEPLYKRSLEIRESKLGKDHPDTANSLHNLAALYHKQNQYSDAEPLYNQSVIIYEANPIAADTGQRLYSNRSLLYKAMDRPEKAVADLKKAMDLTLEVRKNASGSDEQRATTFAQYYDRFVRMVDWQHELGDMHEAYEALERSRAQGLQDLINSSGINLLEGVEPALAKKLTDAENTAQAEIASLNKQVELIYNNSNIFVSEKEKKIEPLSTKLRDAQKRWVEARAAIRSASPIYRLMIGEDRKPVSLDTVQKELENDNAIALEYIIGEEKSYLFVFGKGMTPTLFPLTFDEPQAKLFGVKSGNLTTKNLDTILQNADNTGLLQVVTDPRKLTDDGRLDKETEAKLNALWNILIPDESLRKQLLKHDEVSQIVIMPDGALARLPFEMLIVSPDAVNPQFLLDRAAPILYTPSASMYYNLKQRKLAEKQQDVLTVGNPQYGSASSDTDGSLLDLTRPSRSFARFGLLKPLPWTQQETEWIADSCKENKLSVTRLDLKESTESNVRKNTVGRRLVHLACHGIADDSYGNLFGALALTVGDQNDTKNDGFLTLAEMFGLDLKACELAILSACETNLGPNQHGEGTWSMGRGLLASGSKRVLTTDWQVADDASAHLVFVFVDSILKPQNAEVDYVTALREAKLRIRTDGDHPEWKHPYYWAPFVMIGVR